MDFLLTIEEPCEPGECPIGFVMRGLRGLRMLALLGGGLVDDVQCVTIPHALLSDRDEGIVLVQHVCLLPFMSVGATGG